MFYGIVGFCDVAEVCWGRGGFVRMGGLGIVCFKRVIRNFKFLRFERSSNLIKILL